MESIDTITIGPRLEATFVPADPPRASFFALWQPPAPGALDLGPIDAGLVGALPLKPVTVDLVVSSPAGPVVRSLTVWRLPLRDALEVLAPLSAGADCAPSVVAWAAVVRAGLGLMARGRLLPWVSPAGWDTWRVDPLDPGDHRLVAQLADAMPAVAHAVPSGSGDDPSGVRLVDPVHAIRACYDALADRMVRSAGAARLASSPLFAQLDPIRVPYLRPWVTDISARHCSAAELTLAVDPPVTDDDDEPGMRLDDPFSSGEPWRLRYQLRSRQDPSLVVDAAHLWRMPAEVVRLLGDQAEVDLLGGLRRAADVCDLFVDALGEAHPHERLLEPDELDRFVAALDALAAVGIETRWPAALVAADLSRRLVARSSSPKGGGATLGGLVDLVTVDWEFLLDGVALSRSELELLATAKRAIVPIRGRWIRIDAELRRRLGERAPDLGLGDILAAALLGEWTDPDDPNPDAPTVAAVRVEGELAELVSNLHHPDRRAPVREEPEPEGLCATLRPYQRQGLAWMSDLASAGLGGVLADDMGLGKTVQVLALHAKRGGPTLVVCPTSLIANWEREAARFVPGARVRRYHGAQRSIDTVEPGDIVITTYGVVRSDHAHLAGLDFDLVIADEAQQMKNPRSRTARSLARLRSNARFAVTGTPIENRLSELWSLLDWSVPGLLGSLERFRRDIALPIERDLDRDAARRLGRLTAPFLLRRRKTDPGIAPELPPKTERNVVVPLTAEQVSLYRATTDEVLADVARNAGLVRHGLVLKLLTALKQITNHPAHYLGQTGPLDDRSGKLTALDELVDAAIDGGESMLVFSQYVAMAELLAAHLDRRGVDVGLLHGGLSTTARQSLVDRFQAGELTVLLLSLRAGGTGLNLTRATQVVHYDRWWNPAVEDQATDRAYRIGQDRPVTVHRLITEGTVEDRVADLLDSKRALADRVIGGGESWLGQLDDAELARLVVLAQEAPQ